MVEKGFVSEQDFRDSGNDLALGNSQVQNRSFLNFGIFSQRLGHPNCQAIPHF
jgi:hypothetical protein